MSPPRRSEEPLSVKLTQAQRKAIAAFAPELADRLKPGMRSPRVVRFTEAELKAIRDKAEAAFGRAETGLARNSLRRVIDLASRAVGPSRGGGSVPPSKRIFQFKITLRDTRPPVWRRIQVADGTLDELHEDIQLAMGWTNSHLHQFRFGEKIYGDPDLLQELMEDFGAGNSRTTKLSDVIPADGREFRFGYEYDFGDSWDHEVLFERFVPAEPGKQYPLCVDGKRACPPEDVGGTWGYADYVEAIQDPDHERHDELLEWNGPFDPEAFDPEAATEAMHRGLPSWREWR
jgi:hypothetical protein